MGKIQKAFVALLCLLVLSSGCTKEKAEALKNAAAQFRAEAVGALSQIRTLFKLGVSVPQESLDQVVDKLAKDLEDPAPIDSKTLQFLIHEPSLGEDAQKRIDTSLDPIEASYYQFAAMFDSLPEGSYLAAESVKQAERHAINLTLEFIAFARGLEARPVQFTAARVLLIEEINKAKALSDQSHRREALRDRARTVLALSQQEKTAREQAVLQCLKAAESCRKVADLIRNYSRLSVSDILTITREFLDFAAEVSGGNQNVTVLLGKYKGIEQSIRSDPYWSTLLTNAIADRK